MTPKEKAVCARLHNKSGYPLDNVRESVVPRMLVNLYLPGLGRKNYGEGWCSPREIVHHAEGINPKRTHCIHRNAHTGDYLVFQRLSIIEKLLRGFRHRKPKEKR